MLNMSSITGDDKSLQTVDELPPQTKAPDAPIVYDRLSKHRVKPDAKARRVLDLDAVVNKKNTYDLRAGVAI
jgi:hypothetical protein